MSENIICPNCNTENDCSELSKEELLGIHCGNCDAEIGRRIPKNYLLYDFYYFLFNASIYALIIGTSAYIFENYYEWKSISGFIFLFSIFLASVALHEFFHAFFAYIFGDYTILDHGYLRLNIFKYFHGMYSFIIPGIMILFCGIFLPGAAVYIQTENIKYRLYKFIVFVSGIFAQVIFLYFLLFLINSNSLFFSNDFEALLHVAAYVQLLILLYNLLPLPRHDGWLAISFLTFPRIGMFISRYFYFPSIILIIYLVIFNEEFSFYILDNLDILSAKIGIKDNLILEGFEYMVIFDIDTFVGMQDALFEFIKKL